MAGRLWARAGPVDGTPGHAYLAGRLAWPPAGLGSAVPTSMRWLSSAAIPLEHRARLSGFPAAGCGALVFAWRLANGALTAVSLEALMSDGSRPDWVGAGRWRRTFGSRRGAVFEARSGGPTVHVTEGEVSAVALALAPWARCGRVVALGGTAGVRRADAVRGSPVVIHADGDWKGRKAALAGAAAVEASGRAVDVAWYRGDPATATAEWIGERAAVREFDGGALRDDAERLAWRDLRTAAREAK